MFPSHDPDAELIKVLESVRRHFNEPIHITSGARCEDYNQVIGGSKNSQHLQGKAADFIVNGVSATDVQSFLEHKHPDTYGIGKATNFTHLDVREHRARWFY